MTMLINMNIKRVKAQLVPPNQTIEAGNEYPVVYTRLKTFEDGTTNVVIAIQQYDLPVSEYPLSWFSLLDWEEDV